MKEYQKEFARDLADTGALFFASGLRLKDGRPTPFFVNAGVFRTGRLSARMGAFLAQLIVEKNLIGRFDVLVGPSYKGSALAVSVAQALWTQGQGDVAFEYDRKEAKAHGEATGQKSRFVTGALFQGARVLIVDDVVTTMDTKYSLLSLLDAESTDRKLNLKTVGVILAVNREQSTAVYDALGQVIEGVRGEDAMARFTKKTGLPVHTLVGIRQVVHFLAEDGRPVLIDGVKRPLDAGTLETFNQYLDIYGVVGA